MNTCLQSLYARFQVFCKHVGKLNQKTCGKIWSITYCDLRPLFFSRWKSQQGRSLR
ncbi:hypothetical protein BRADI_5g22839v3 [Brachypodium distachyon]|uniref:Uncharacterized protein n=1 Tax=Brachypodium distachyon TaxID=15368 RepID=A0A0Q3P742_BRADI|nr:hypothetical protein BRADI_5g22839v3 [Brachypodium distachyon]